MQEHLGFLFPGQGSQRIGMLSEAAQAFPVVAETFGEASEALGYDLWALTQAGDPATLNLTEYAQPALLTASVSLWRAWLAAGGPRPAAMAGHSLGELSALCCADVFTLADAVRLVQERGRAMQQAVPVGEGAMAAVIGLSAEQVIAICAEVSASLNAVVAAVNFNSEAQVVIAGQTAAVDYTIERLIGAGAKRALPLPVSAPFHTSLMAPAGERMAVVLQAISLKAPTIPVIHNVHARSESDPERIRELLVSQISAPVRWTDCMGKLMGTGCRQLVECGAGKVLGGLARRIDKSLSCAFIEQPDDLHAAVQKLSAGDGN
ncbi:MAG: [acyl-carrier-protein] S-malonyltransferase [Halieaceae bacterium]